MALKTGISGLRGTVAPGEVSLTATQVVAWVQAFVAHVQAERCKDKDRPVDRPVDRPFDRAFDRAFDRPFDRPFIALGHDARRSSPALAALAKGALLTAGADVLDLGLTLTPTVQLTVRRDVRLDAGLMITASHNPVIWNGLKFLDSQGFFIPLTWWEAMRKMLSSQYWAGAGAGQNNLPSVALDQVGRVEQAGAQAWQAHLQATLDVLPIETIRRQRYRVALDACNGATVRWAEMLQALGCEPILLHTEQHGFFAREAEPLPAHLGALRDLVRHAGCDLGLAADPDGDRLVLVDAHGHAVSEEHTVVLVGMALAQRPGDTIALNVVTTHALEEAIPTATVVRTAVGEMNVVAGTIAHNAVLGGEGSGGIIIPKINMARDGVAAAGMILTLMAQQNAPLHELVARIPVWHATKTKLRATEGSPDALRALFRHWKSETPQARLTGHTLHVSSSDGFLSLTLHDDTSLTMSGKLPDGGIVQANGDGRGLAPIFVTLDQQRDALTLDLIDGVKLYADGAWLSLRPSNTEPILRVMGEVRAT